MAKNLGFEHRRALARPARLPARDLAPHRPSQRPHLVLDPVIVARPDAFFAVEHLAFQ
jgi:hypothetical protein